MIRQEARHRLTNGYGIRVFSRPDALRDWFQTRRLTIESRRQFIVDAGTTVPGFSLQGPERAEFFVHCPFGWRQNEREVVDRNQDSIVFQAAFAEGASPKYALFASDIKAETIIDIVRITRQHRREERLTWDLFKVPHHCSYTALSLEKGTNQTQPEPEIAWLFENRGRRGGILVSTSDSIPSNDRNDQPPHRQAANYFKSIANRIGGQFRITMESSDPRNPTPCHVRVDATGLAFGVGEPGKSGLLRGATSALGAFTFPNRPVAPTKPSGFA